MNIECDAEEQGILMEYGAMEEPDCISFVQEGLQ